MKHQKPKERDESETTIIQRWAMKRAIGSKGFLGTLVAVMVVLGPNARDAVSEKLGFVHEQPVSKADLTAVEARLETKIDAKFNHLDERIDNMRDRRRGASLDFTNSPVAFGD